MMLSVFQDNRSLVKKSDDLLTQSQKLGTTNIALKEENKYLVNNVQATNKVGSNSGRLLRGGYMNNICKVMKGW